MKILPVLFCLLVSALPQYGQSLLKPTDRVVFIGDSITGQGGNAGDGWVHLIDRGLKAAHPDAAHTLVALGGSGQTVGSWQGVEMASREKPTILDVPGVDVMTELGQPADVVVIMLGMNDVLFPRTGNSPESVEAWGKQYRELIRAVRERVRPRVLALATPTMCTEDPESPKNLAMKSFAAQIETLAKEENAVVLPTWETMKEVLDEGLTYRPDFHVLGDSVHPSGPGHTAIAMGMLRGLGEPEAARSIHETWVNSLAKPPSLSYRIAYQGSVDSKEKDRFKISYSYKAKDAAEPPPEVALAVPEGWTVTPEKLTATAGDFTVEGTPDHLNSVLTLKVAGEETEIRIPAPWLLGSSGGGGQKGWQGNDFQPEQGRVDADAELARGKGWGESIEISPNNPLSWSRYFSTRAYGGEGKSGFLDFSAVSYVNPFTVGYGARWLFCEEARTLKIRIASFGFVRQNYLTLWLNGREIFSGDLAKDLPPPIVVQLDKGWNSLVFRSNHRELQWQFGIELSGETGQPLDNVRFRATPP